MEEFVASLRQTRNALRCPSCRKPIQNPVRYLACLHTVCAVHVEKSNFCVICNVKQNGSGTVPDPQLADIAETFFQLDAIFAKKDTETNAHRRKHVNKSIMSTSRTESPKTTSLEKRNSKGETALHVACRILKMCSIRDLLEKGANPNTTDNAGWTPLHEVTQKGKLEAVKLLLKHKALSDVPGLDNETPLHEAVRYGHVEIATELVKHGADIKAKNIKGETPLSLADKNMEEALLSATEDIVLTQSENIREISMIHMDSDFENMHVYCNVPYRLVLQKLKKLAKKHNITVETKFSDKVTHVVIAVEDDDNTATSSADVLRAIVSGVWILNYKWVMKSTEDHLENFDEYEIAGVFIADGGPSKSRYNKYKKLPGLFDGCHFYLHNFNKDFEMSKSLILTKSLLSELITKAGGKVLKRVPNPESIPPNETTVPYHAAAVSPLAKCSHYIIFSDTYEPMYNMTHFKALPVGWLIECIQKYELCDP